MELKPGYKQTEVGVIPEEWRVEKINQLLEDKAILSHLDGNHGELYPRSSEFKQHGVPYIGANDFSDGFVTFDRCKFLSEERAAKFRKGVAKNGDVLFAHNATVGPVAFLKTSEAFVILSTTATYFRCNEEKINNIYLKFALESSHFVKQYQAVMAQSTRFQVPITAQRKLFLVTPPLPEQCAIAAALSDVEALIASLDKLITKKRDLKQATMQQLLTGKQRLPGFSGEWEVKRLGDVLKVRHGRSQHDVVERDGAYPILATGGEIGRTNTFLYDKPSVLIGRKGTIDKPQYQDAPFWTVDTLFYTELSNTAHPKFIYFKFLMIDWRSYNEASGVPSLNASTIENIEIAVPRLGEQTAIATMLSDMDADIAALEARRDKIRALKQGMMQELLTGRIRLI